MTKAIQQSIVLKASPEELFETFLDSKKHSAATGAPAEVSRRASHWKDQDPDSILVLHFSAAPGGGRIDLVHAGVPHYDHKGVKQGWPTYYWKPWKAYLAER